MEIEAELRPAVVVIGYNRIKSLKRLLNSIERANYDFPDITLVISIDKSDNCSEVLEVAETFDWKHGEKIVRTFEVRQGLRQHVLQCGDLSEQYGAVIILEDDIVVSPEFYNYIVSALQFYRDEEKLAGIALYSHKYNGYAQKLFEPIHNGYDTYMGQFGLSWGQCWTQKQWKAFREWFSVNGQMQLTPQNDIPLSVTNWSDKSWGKYFIYYMIQTDKYYVMPYEALATCFADIGEHSKFINTTVQVPLLMGKRNYRFAKFDEAEKYDLFFESKDLKKNFSDDIAEDLCIDLYGVRVDRHTNRYLLTLKKMPYKQLKSFGLLMRPRELNVRYQIEGDDIFLYDTQTPAGNDKKEEWSELAYDAYAMTWRTALRYGIKGFARGVLRRLKK